MVLENVNFKVKSNSMLTLVDLSGAEKVQLKIHRERLCDECP